MKRSFWLKLSLPYCLLAFGFLILFHGVVSFAGDGEREIRPSYLVNVENANIMPPSSILLSLYGTHGRFAFGLPPAFEVRTDFQMSSNAIVGNIYNFGLTLKAHLFGDGAFKVGLVEQVQAIATATPSSFNSYSIMLPISLMAGPFILSVNQYITGTTDVNAVLNNGTSVGITISIWSSFALLAEAKLNSAGTTSTIGYLSGFLLKPTSRITIPIVVVSQDNSSTSLALGTVGLYAHIGFEI